MNIDQYQQDAARTRNFEDVKGALLGLAGETGELCELFKKHFYHDRTLHREAVVEELGDVLWYLSAVADIMDIPLSEVARANIDKLRERHPDGFDPTYHER